jgi:integrase
MSKDYKKTSCRTVPENVANIKGENGQNDSGLTDAKTQIRKSPCQRYKRRTLTITEIVQLLKAAEERPIHELTKIRTEKQKGTNNVNVSEEVKDQAKRLGLERKLLYATLIYTGLRESELASITVGQVFIDAEIPYIALTAKQEKMRRGATLPLHSELTKHLKQWLKLKGDVSPKEKLFHIPNGLCKVLNCDLKFAGIEKRDHLNRVVDVYSLRNTLAALLVKHGVSFDVAIKAMRCWELRKTLRLYVHHDTQDVAEAINRIQDFLNEK